MRKLFLIFLFLPIFILYACGVPSEANLGTPENDRKKSNYEVREINQLVVDNENVKITILNMKKNKEQSKQTVTITFDILNKRKDTMKIQAQRLSVDDRMVDEAIYQLEQEISPKKATTAKLVIQQLDDIEFPEFKNDLEMELYILSLDDPNYVENHHVKIIYE